VQRPGDQGQQNLESEDKNCASYNWRSRSTEFGKWGQILCQL